MTSDFGSTKESETLFNPTVGTYPGSYSGPTKNDPWILGTYASRTVREGGTGWAEVPPVSPG